MKKALFFIFGFLYWASVAQAQVVFTSLEEAITYAMQNRPDLLNEQLAQQVAAQQVARTTSALYPQVKASSAFENYLALPVQLIPAEFLDGPKGELVAVQFGTQYNLSFGLEAALPLVNVQAWQNRRIALAEATVSQFKVLDAQQRAAEEIARAYYLCLLSKEAIQLSQENTRINDTLVMTAQERYKNGLVEPLEINRLKALQLESKQQLLDNHTVYKNNLLKLKVLTGIAPQEELSLPKELLLNPVSSLPPHTPVEQLSLYQALQWRIKVAEEEKKKQRLRWLPDVSAFGHFTQQAQRNTFNFTDGAAPWYQIGVVGLRADWLLFGGFLRTAELKRATLQKQMAENELAYFTMKAKAEAQEITQTLQNAQQSLENYRQHYTLYVENYDLARFKYGAEVYTVDQLLQVYGEKLKSQNLLLNALAAYYVNRALLQIKNQFAQPSTPFTNGN